MNFMFHKKKSIEIDEHEMPTEPVPDKIPQPIAHTPLLVPSAGGAAGPVQNAYQPYNGAFPYPAGNYNGYTQPGYAGYSIPMEPAGSSLQPVTTHTPETTEQPISRNGPGMWYSLWPRAVSLGVGLCFVGVQIVLVLHFLVTVVNLPINTLWGAAVEALSAVALLPFYAVLPPIQLPILARIEPYTLLAIVLYGLCSRLIVHLLKILLGVSRVSKHKQ